MSQRVLVMSDCPRLHEEFRLDVARHAYTHSQARHLYTYHERLVYGGTTYYTLLGSHPLPEGVQLDQVWVLGVDVELRRLGREIAQFHGATYRHATRVAGLDSSSRQEGDGLENYFAVDRIVDVSGAGV